MPGRNHPYQDIFEKAIAGMFQVSLEGRYLRVNPALAKLYGYESQEMLLEKSTNISKQLYINPKRWDELLAKICADGFVYDFVSEVHRKDGGRIWITENARLVRDAADKELYIEGTATEITQHKMLEERIRQAEKMEALRQLASGLSRDFNDSIGAMRGYAEMLSLELKSDERLHRYAENIVTASRRAAELTEKLQSFAKVSDCHPRLLDLHSMLDGIVTLLERSFEKKLRIDKKLWPGKIAVMADAALLETAILNMAINSREAMPDGGTLSIETSITTLASPYPWCQPQDFHPGTHVGISITDTGTGMSEEVQQKLFQPLYTTKEGGTGFGLATVYASVRNHRGTINVQSSPGKGSCFQLYLPIDNPAANEAMRKSSAPLVKGKGQILLAEDNDLNRKLMEEMLQSMGYEVKSCANGKEAISIYRETPGDFDLSILDVDLPDMDGFDAFAEISSIKPGAKALLVSGISHGEKLQRLIDSGSAKFLKKPFSIKTFSQKVAESFSLRNPAAKN
ncbi:MAG: hypothetical protein A2X49_12865 [Lentisphaerae bacterium GWF2_52_8]|nr:MAG: hypothetical protein A2X49_12865 [Lentisphaerae bacterium GWF2_52_8]